MLHLVYSRPESTLKVYDAMGALYKTYTAAGDAWGNHGVPPSGPQPPYGYDCWCPPGHFRLGVPEFFNPAIVSEGFGQIPVMDLDADLLATLASSGRAIVNGKTANIGGIIAEISQLSRFGRSEIMIHCGGSNAPDPTADYQELCRTYGCTRMFNIEWREMAHWLEPQMESNAVIYTIIGDPKILAC